MLSALKKLVGSEGPPAGERERARPIPAGLQAMNRALQRRFAKGVQYNMKIVIRGDRNTGKTTLWHRLQGKAFIEEYIPTQEIQVTSIHWNYKTTDDIVKVEVWDVVDKGKCKKRGDGLKLENDPQEAESELALDAEFLDVYKNCNGVVMMFDITKQWTFNYILRELPKVPTHVPVCVLGNYRDMGEHRVILPDDVREFIRNLNRPPGSSYFRYAESSMKNSFGLKYLHKFFNIPFLQLQRETLLRQLETNQLDIDATLEELSVQQETEDQNYEIFLEMMEVRSRSHASPPAPNGQSPSSGSQSPTVAPGSTGSSSPGTPQPAAAAAAVPGHPPPAPGVPPAPPQRRGIISRLFGGSAAEAAPAPPEPAVPAEIPARVQSVEDFVPEDSLDRSFLEDVAPRKDEKKGKTKVQRDSDSDGEVGGGNPMVTGFQDDLDLDDRLPGPPSPPTGPSPSQNVALSSEDEAEEEEEEAPRVSGPAPGESAEPEAKWSSQNLLKPEEAASSKAPEPKPPGSVPPRSGGDGPPGESPPASPAASRDLGAGSRNRGCSPRPQDGAHGTPPRPEGSDSDPEGPIAAQMLSFVMDDPDFESEESDTQKKKGDEFPVREDLSDPTDEETPPAKLPEPMKPTIHSFKLKNDSDLFGLGIEEAGAKESSDEDKEGKLPAKEKKKKKKKNKEEEEKAGKKKSGKPKKTKDKEEGRDERKRKKKRSKEKNEETDELEAFLGGGSKQRGGGDYEEL
ncbi:rab-like protein 6 isoform X1 [Tachyglossus aculeatus]|uniref:rab-like protein 6 isoform X1 n=1 Tax=Tachyglossus aculeatus TaxID=9261 RepID=UPI0018F67D38|nr:rab-like protein 6 isoform X1 [Tachyglossus aculeatus]